MNHAAKKINAADEDDVIFDRSIDFLKGQIPITQKEWEDLHIDPKVRLRAFCVANQTKADYVYLIRQQLIDAVEKGKGISESWSDLKNLIDTDNIDPIRPGYWETVYRTNMNTAYTAGKLMEFEETKPVAIQLFFINDDRQSH
ncbi:MAG: phage head morphogenesis protein, partial [Spirochaetia bacterium]|nr:phage head morphogenesis protein [Spirochaetia bacterium]